MSYSDDLHPASFRGVGFHVDDGGMTTGRRVTVHKYAKRDKPYSEDNGRLDQGFTINGFVVGPGWLSDTDRLITALEKEGVGKLVHPWRGEMLVQSGPVKVSWDRKAGRANFSMLFHEAGEVVFPTASADLTLEGLAAVDAANQAVMEDFAANHNVKGMPDHVAIRTLEVIGELSKYIGKDIKDFDVRDALSIASAVTKAIDLSDVSIAGFKLAPVVNTFNSVTQSQVAKNALALGQLTYRSGLIKDTKVAINTVWQVYDYAVSERGRLQGALDTEARSSGSRPVFTALSTLRKVASKVITQKSVKAKRLETVVFDRVVPTLVQAYEKYEDASRAGEIAQRNGVNHPGFMRGAMKVLSS